MTASPTADPVRYELKGSVAVITLNRPDYRNAQNSAMTYALDAAFSRAVDDEQVKVIVLAGEGKHFCAGHDIGTRKSLLRILLNQKNRCTTLTDRLDNIKNLIHKDW